MINTNSKLLENTEYTIHKWNLTSEEVSLHVIFKNRDIYHDFIWVMRIGFDYMSSTLIFPASQFGGVCSESRTYRKSHSEKETKQFYKEILAFMDITKYEYHDSEVPYCTIDVNTYKEIVTLWKMKGRC